MRPGMLLQPSLLITAACVVSADTFPARTSINNAQQAKPPAAPEHADKRNTLLLDPTTTFSSSSDGDHTSPTLGTHSLSAVFSAVPIAKRIGLIMPDPQSKIYVGTWNSRKKAHLRCTGLEYTFGLVEAVPRPAPTIGGWLRLLQPLLTFPDYQVRFSEVGVGLTCGNRSAFFQMSVPLCQTTPQPSRPEVPVYAGEALPRRARLWLKTQRDGGGLLAGLAVQL